ncbi:biotin transporter BioY [Desulforhopalus singaporensis]|uniref:Biotin transporter n=1 Tax=Desulforhopalus singaporensis TaxID=91360 RepID=A0A1H0RWY2_9BACT|nr:biotin transporter BioY [Desulforhopalus singaporensis]SDP33865.1 biotin transport system substrate-specific component [Desulforhopalus singaporensis]
MDASAQQLRKMVYAALMAALTAAGAYIAIPIGPVPIVLQNLFVMLAGLLLGKRWGLISVAVYLVAGAVGLPVFAGGTGGIGKFVGPTGGYLAGFAAAAFVIGAISEKGGNRVIVDIVAMIVGTAVIYGVGVSWLSVVTGMGWYKALTVGMFPFLIGDGVKIAAAVPIARALRPIMKEKACVVQAAG